MNTTNGCEESTPYHAFKLDIVQISFINCLVQEFEIFQNNYKGMEHKRKYAKNAFRSFEICAQKNGLSSNNSIYLVAKNCLESCINKRFTNFFVWKLLSYSVMKIKLKGIEI